MGQVRFSTVRDLFDAYPSAPDDVGEADDSLHSLDFLRSRIGARQWQPAISYCAYLLPRRGTVAWACRSLRRMTQGLAPEEDRMVGFAEAWVEQPEEPRRRKALASGNMGSPRSPATWIALAAGWSGGSIVPAELGYAAADPEQTAKAVRVALFIALSRLDDDSKDRVMTACLEDAIQLACGASAASR